MVVPRTPPHPLELVAKPLSIYADARFIIADVITFP